MDSTATQLIKTEYRAFAMKAFKTLNHGRSLGHDRYLELLADRLASVATGELKRLVISLPPRHAKTFMGSICFVPWILAHDPAAKILLLSYGQDLADKIAYAIREIMRSSWYHQAFRTRIAADRAKVSDFMTTAGWRRSVDFDRGRRHRNRRRLHHH